MSVPMYTDGQEKFALGGLIRELFSKVSELITTQIELAKTEVKAESRKLGLAVVFGITALIIGTLFALFLGVSLILLLAKAVDLAWASVITTAFYLLVAGIAAGMAVKELRKNAGDIDVG